MDNRHPDPALAEEAKRLIDELLPLIARTIEGDGDTLRFTVTVPKEHAILAAWLIFKADMEAAGKPGVLPRPVMLHFDDGRRTRDWKRAKDYFTTIIGEELNREWRRLRDLAHPVLFRDDDQ